MLQYLTISPQSFEVLARSRGDLWHLRFDRDAWQGAYQAEIQKTVNQIGYRPGHVLDIGSGLGGIDVCLSKAYGSACILVDGENGSGKPRKHAEPFCGRDLVEAFWRDNEVEAGRLDYRNPDQLADADPLYDLILSTRSWCFHYEPERYLAYVLRHACPCALVLVDMRRGKPAWRETMGSIFEELFVAESGEKFDRIAYRVRGRVQ